MTSAARHDVVVIGAGMNGLAAATRLAQAGRKTLLLEREETLGGRGRLVELAPGFRAAPFGSDPGWVPPSIARTLGLRALERAPASTTATVLVEPGSFLTIPADPSRAAAAIESHSAGDARKWPEFTARMGRLAGFLETLYQTSAPDISASSLREWLPMLGVARKARALGRRDMIELLRTLPVSIWELLDDWFESPSLKALAATGGIHDHRQGPRSGGTGFVYLHHRVGAPAGALRRGAWARGPAHLTDSAVEAARRSGVAIRAGAKVSRILVRNDAVAGVVLEGGEELPAGTVLSTASPATTLLDWVDPVWLDPEFLLAVKNIRHRGCTALVLYALESLPQIPGLSPEALAGTVSLTPRVEALEKAADAAKYGAVSDPPHVELTIPTVLWPDQGQGGRHVLVARVMYTPYRIREGAWDETRGESLAERVTAAIASVSPCFTSRITKRVTWTPQDLEERFGFREGAPTQGELGLDQILFMRPVAGWGTHGTPIDGLYLGGSGSHPGPGIPGGAGWLAARRILGGRKKRRRA